MLFQRMFPRGRWLWNHGNALPILIHGSRSLLHSKSLDNKWNSYKIFSQQQDDQKIHTTPNKTLKRLSQKYLFLDDIMLDDTTESSWVETRLDSFGSNYVSFWIQKKNEGLEKVWFFSPASLYIECWLKQEQSSSVVQLWVLSNIN